MDTNTIGKKNAERERGERYAMDAKKRAKPICRQIPFKQTHRNVCDGRVYKFSVFPLVFYGRTIGFGANF